MARAILSGIAITFLALGASAAAGDKEVDRIANRPQVPGVLQLHLRERREEPAGSGTLQVVERTVDWKVSETVVIACDMWDDHHCKLAAQRVGVMAPRMNQVLTAARDRGVMIIYAPSETMNVYANTYHAMLINGELKDGLACDDGAGLLFEGDKLAQVVTVSAKAGAYRVRRDGAQLIEEPLEAEVLVKAPK